MRKWPLSASISQKDYRDAWCFRLGAQYALTHRFDLRFGMMIDTTPVDKHNYNPETPGMTKIEPTAGFTFNPTPYLGVNVGVMYVAGLGVDGASYPEKNIFTGATNLFTADYRVHSFTASVGLSLAF